MTTVSEEGLGTCKGEEGEKSEALLTSSVTDQVQIIEDSYVIRTPERLETSCAVACALTLLLNVQLFVTKSHIQMSKYKL